LAGLVIPAQPQTTQPVRGKCVGRAAPVPLQKENKPAKGSYRLRFQTRTKRVQGKAGGWGVRTASGLGDAKGTGVAGGVASGRPNWYALAPALTANDPRPRRRRSSPQLNLKNGSRLDRSRE
jgi:hypothetical protein